MFSTELLAVRSIDIALLCICCFPVNIVICCHEYHSSSSSANEWGRGMCSGTFNVILHCIQCIFKFNKNFFECFIAYSNKIVEQIQKFSLIFTFPAKNFQFLSIISIILPSFTFYLTLKCQFFNSKTNNSGQANSVTLFHDLNVSFSKLFICLGNLGISAFFFVSNL